MKATFALFTLCIALLWFSNASAQQRVQGKIVDKQGTPLEFVHVVAILPDSTFVKGVVSDAKGSFALDALPEACSLIINAIGYQKQHVTPKAAMHIVLEESTTDLDEVRISRQRIKQHSGGYEINLIQSPLTQSGSIIRTLNMLPNVHVADDGAVNILYRPVASIYLDGLRLQDQKELNAIPVDQIERIGIDYSATTNEGAEARGGVLHIYLKPQAKGGYYGQLNANTDYYWHYGSTGGRGYFYMSGRWDRVTLRNSLDFEQQRSLSEEENTSYDKVTGTKQQSLYSYRAWTTGLSDRLSLTYSPNSRHIIASSVYGELALERPIYTTQDLTHNTSTVERAHNPTGLLQWQLKYTWAVNSRSTFALATDYLKRAEAFSNTEEDKSTGGNNETVTWINDMIRVKSTFSKNFANDATLTIGGDMHWIAQVEKNIMPRTPNPLTVDTKVHALSPALFTTYAGSSGNLQYEIGLRLQHDQLQTSYPTYDRTIYQHIRRKSAIPKWGIYPSLSLMYILNQERGHSLTLQAERTTDKIPYTAIGNYKDYSSSYTYEVGNPSLRIPTETQVMLNAVVFGLLNFTVGGIFSEDPIYYRTQIDPSDPQTTFTQPTNGKYQLLNFGAIECRLPITPWWMTKTRALARLHNGDAGVKVRNQWSSAYSHNSIFNFNQSFGAGVNLNYEPTAYLLDMKLHSIFHVGGYLYTNFFSNALKMRLEFVAYRQQRIIDTERTDISHRYANLLRAPWATLSITYTFEGGKKVKALPDTDELQSYEKMQNPNR